MSATPIATRYSYEFIRGNLPESARSILEVGCGRGELAWRLAQDGLRVLALDADADCVAAANAAGVDARLAAWPTEIDGEFDAVLFTRSLHHIRALDPAVEAAVAALRPGGRVIVEDFRAEGGTDRSAAWFTGRVNQLERDGALPPDFEVESILTKAAPSVLEHDLHSSRAIGEALGRHGQIRVGNAAYYFRYLEDLVNSVTTQSLLDEERALMAAGEIDALGRRYVLIPHA